MKLVVCRVLCAKVPWSVRPRVRAQCTSYMYVTQLPSARQDRKWFSTRAETSTSAPQTTTSWMRRVCRHRRHVVSDRRQRHDPLYITWRPFYVAAISATYGRLRTKLARYCDEHSFSNITT